jgi:hypothetical protein
MDRFFFCVFIEAFLHPYIRKASKYNSAEGGAVTRKTFSDCILLLPHKLCNVLLGANAGFSLLYLHSVRTY